MKVAHVARRGLAPASSRGLVKTLGLALIVVGGSACGDRAAPSPEPTSARPEPVTPTAGATAPATSAPPPTAFGCIRGGTSRAEVLALMGEPDSVSYGVWLYGASEVSFGYGVVVDYRDVDGALALCSDGSERPPTDVGGADGAPSTPPR